MPDLTPPRDTSIVAVMGAMNPAVHTPHFYRSIGAMDEAELQASLTQPLNSTTAASSQFQFGSPSLLVSCQPGQWWIQAADIQSWERMLKIVGLVFGKLGATPISGYALVAQRHVDTTVADVKSALAERIVGTRLGFPSGKSVASNIELVINEEDYAVTTSVQPSVVGEQVVYMFYQRNYTAPTPSAGTFALEPVIRVRLTGFEDGYSKFFDAVMASVSSTREVTA